MSERKVVDNGDGRKFEGGASAPRAKRTFSKTASTHRCHSVGTVRDDWTNNMLYLDCHEDKMSVLRYLLRGEALVAVAAQGFGLRTCSVETFHCDVYNAKVVYLLQTLTRRFGLGL